jgi:hypothetical protein
MEFSEKTQRDVTVCIDLYDAGVITLDETIVKFNEIREREGLPNLSAEHEKRLRDRLRRAS